MMNKNVLLLDIDRLKKESYIDANVSEDTIRTAAIYIQDTIIENVIGTCLFNCLCESICDGKINDPFKKWHKRLLDDYLFKIFVYGIQAEISIPLSFKVRNAGTIQSNVDDLTQAQLNDIKYLNQYYNNKKDFYVNSTIQFLSHNYCEFPELTSCTCEWCCKLAGSTMYTTPLNLKKNPICNWKK